VGEMHAVPREHEFIAILPLGVFMDLFSDSSEVWQMLKCRAETVLSDWMEKNKSAKMVGKRRPVGVTWNLCECAWKTSRGRQEERSVWCLQISTFNYTINHQQDLQPKITAADLKVD
jgi:hypothetical protein